MDSNKKEQTAELKDQVLLEELEENSFICLIIRTLSDVFIRYDVIIFIYKNRL